MSEGGLNQPCDSIYTGPQTVKIIDDYTLPEASSFNHRVPAHQPMLSQPVDADRFRMDSQRSYHTSPDARHRETFGPLDESVEKVSLVTQEQALQVKISALLSNINSMTNNVNNENGDLEEFLPKSTHSNLASLPPQIERLLSKPSSYDAAHHPVG